MRKKYVKYGLAFALFGTIFGAKVHALDINSCNDLKASMGVGTCEGSVLTVDATDDVINVQNKNYTILDDITINYNSNGLVDKFNLENMVFNVNSNGKLTFAGDSLNDIIKLQNGVINVNNGGEVIVNGFLEQTDTMEDDLFVINVGGSVTVNKSVSGGQRAFNVRGGSLKLQNDALISNGKTAIYIPEKDSANNNNAGVVNVVKGEVKAISPFGTNYAIEVLSKEATLTIKDGLFEGMSGGLYIGFSDISNIKLSGGTFVKDDYDPDKPYPITIANTTNIASTDAVDLFKEMLSSNNMYYVDKNDITHYLDILQAGDDFNPARAFRFNYNNDAFDVTDDYISPKSTDYNYQFALSVINVVTKNVGTFDLRTDSVNHKDISFNVDDDCSGEIILLGKDGKFIDLASITYEEDNYFNLSNGKLTIPKNYLKTLEEGKYDLVFANAQGKKTYNYTFDVVKTEKNSTSSNASIGTNQSSTSTNDNAGSTTSSASGSNPHTADTIITFVVLLGVSISGLLTTRFIKRRKF